MTFLKKNFFLIFLFFLFYPFNLLASNPFIPSAGFDCSDNKNQFEFLFDRSINMDNPIVYRRVNGSFREIGNVIAEKQGAYAIWEDKDFFRTTDFVWIIDKVTSKLSSSVLSVGLGIENLAKIPKPMTCMQKIFYY